MISPHCESLIVTPVSQQSAKQRAGRAGRVKRNIVFHLMVSGGVLPPLYRRSLHAASEIFLARNSAQPIEPVYSPNEGPGYIQHRRFPLPLTAS